MSKPELAEGNGGECRDADRQFELESETASWMSPKIGADELLLLPMAVRMQGTCRRWLHIYRGSGPTNATKQAQKIRATYTNLSNSYGPAHCDTESIHSFGND